MQLSIIESAFKLKASIESVAIVAETDFEFALQRLAKLSMLILPLSWCVE